MFEDVKAGVIHIGPKIFVKSEEGLFHAIAQMQAVGYEVENLAESNSGWCGNRSLEERQQQGAPMWLAKLDVRRGKCKSCKKHIRTLGIRQHGHTCEHCQAVTYREITKGSKIRFKFESPEESMSKDLTMEVYCWDTEGGVLYLQPKVEKGLSSTESEAERYFQSHADKWDEVSYDGRRLIKIDYPHPVDYENQTIDIRETRGHYFNYKFVWVWQGVEYDVRDPNFPLPERLNIYETWHWAPLSASQTIYKKILNAAGLPWEDDCYENDDFYFSDDHIEWMGKFVRHFTKLDADAWDRESQSFRRCGWDGVVDIAAFCGVGLEEKSVPRPGGSDGFGDIFSRVPEGLVLNNAFPEGVDQIFFLKTRK